MKRLSIAARLGLALLAGVLLAFTTSHSRSAQPNDRTQNTIRDFMRAKMPHSQQVLEGLVMEDFDKLAKNSQKLSLLSLESNWNVLQTTEYLQHSNAFRHSADRLTKAAREKNLDGATLAYVDMTIRCVNCHKYVRKTPRSKER